MKIKNLFYVILVIVFSAGSILSQEIPRSIFYQGNLADANGDPIKNPRSMTFSIWDAERAGTQLWTEEHTNVPIIGGLFSVVLGVPDNPIPVEAFSVKTRYLQIKIGSEILTPRQQIISVPYAYSTASVHGASNVFPSDGKVGIGTTAPETILDIKDGDIKIEYGGSPRLYLYSRGNGSQKYSIRATNDEDEAGGARFVIKNEIYGSDVFTVTGGGGATSDRVGIGTISPTEKLEVAGTILGVDPDADGIGVLGRATNNGNANNYGGYFTADGWHSIGVYGGALGNARMSGAYHYGGYFEAENNEGGIGIFAKGGHYSAILRGKAQIQDAAGNPVMELGAGLDYAEGFDVSENEEISPGSVLIIDPENPGKLTLCNKPYDSKVAGIVAGANGLGSGVRLGVDQFDYDVALAGRVYCNVEAINAGIEPGDLLTSSSIPGYAMKATNYPAAQGAILGKAMERMEKGQKGKILVLVTLQ